MVWVVVVAILVVACIALAVELYQMRKESEENYEAYERDIGRKHQKYVEANRRLQELLAAAEKFKVRTRNAAGQFTYENARAAIETQSAVDRLESLQK